MPKLRRRQLRIPNIRFIGQSRSKKNSRNSSSHSRNDAAVAGHQASDDQSLLSGSTAPQNELNLEDNPHFAEEVVKDESHQWTDAVKEHYLKNMNSMAPTTTNQDTDDNSCATPLISNNNMNSMMAMSNQRNRTNDADDDTSATPIRSNRHHHETSKASSRRPRNFRRGMMTTNQRARANDADDDTNCTPLISNCHEDERSDFTSSISVISNATNISNVTPIMSNCHNTCDGDGDGGDTIACSSLDDASLHISSVHDDHSVTHGRREDTEEFEERGITSRVNSGIDENAGSMFKRVVLPALVITLYLIAFLLSSYSSLSCKFMKCDIDFIPINIKIGQTDPKFGPWAFLALSGDGDNKICSRYPSDFKKKYIESDYRWKATRATSVLTIIIGWIGLVIICIGVSRIKFILSMKWIQIIDTYWKGFTIGTSTLLLILETVMFSFQSIDMCKKDDIWMRQDGIFESADKCSLSTGAFCSLFAIICYFCVTCLLIFLSIFPAMNENQISTLREDSRPDLFSVRSEPRLFCTNNYEAVSDDSSNESNGSPVESSNMEELESMEFSANPSIVFDSNISSSLGNVRMQQFKDSPDGSLQSVDISTTDETDSKPRGFFAKLATSVSPAAASNRAGDVEMQQIKASNPFET